MTLDLTYPGVLKLFGYHAVPGRLESRAFLGWFLENYFRLDGATVDDCICDGPDDRGVDGIYVDTTREVVFVFQAKLFQGPNKTLGDGTLREFSGTLGQFLTPQSISALAAGTGNLELKGLLESEEVAAKVGDGYAIRGICITNVALDSNGELFRGNNDQIDVYDSARLNADWLPLGDVDPVNQEMSFHLDGLGVIQYTTPDTSVYIASLRGSELISLAGIENQSLFAWNVRQSLGRTKVNRAIAENVAQLGEHKNFMLYHNGLTVLATDVHLDLENDVLRINRYSVVNGAQSLSTLYDKKMSVTDELRLLTRVVALDPSTDLAAKITRNSNNQNSIGARDMQSNSVIQKRLKEDFARTFPRQYGYEIKRGEKLPESEIITNEEAARVLLAFDLEQPWSCHQAYRYFDDLHADIFGRPIVTAARIVGLMALKDAVVGGLQALDNQLAARYSVTPYFMMYLTKQALILDQVGCAFAQDPGRFVLEGGRERLERSLRPVVDDLVIDFNAELKERAEEGRPFDHKRELKSPSAVRALRGEIIPGYEKALKRQRASSFTYEWETALAAAGTEDTD